MVSRNIAPTFMKYLVPSLQKGASKPSFWGHRPVLSIRNLVIYSTIVAAATVLWVLFVLVPPFHVKIPAVSLPYLRLPVVSVPSIHVKLPVIRTGAIRVPGLYQVRLQSLVTDVRGVATWFVLGLAYNVRDALSVVGEEYDRTTAERDAFDQFARAVAEAEPATNSTDVSPTATLVLETNQARSELESVERAYRETVMSVSHYEQEYDESLAVNMATEFGDELAMAVLEGEKLTPQLQESLYVAAIEARERRERFRSLVEAERTDLQRVKRTFGELDATLTDADESALLTRSFDELAALHERLERERETCERLLASRQRQRREGHAGRVRAPGLPDLQSYLYGSLDVQYPVLADAVSLIDDVQRTQRRVRSELTRRV